MRSHQRLARTLAVILCFFVTCVCLAAEPALAPGTAFPRLTGKSLNGNEVVLPDASAGKPSLLILTFSKAAGDRSRKWTEQFVKDFPDDSRATSYSVAMLSSAPGFVRGMIRSAMKRGTPEKLRPRTVIVTSDDKPWKERIGVTNDKDPYLVLLDSKGQVVWMNHGEFDPKVLQQCEARIAELESGAKK